MKLRKRLAALTLAGAMLISTLPMHALATENTNTSGMCEHHPQHTEECGYSEGTQGTPCGHQHTEECYTMQVSCIHQHTQACYPEQPEQSEQPEPTACTHACSEDTGCVTNLLDCKHIHDDSCGYTEGSEGSPCRFVCEICGKAEQPADPTDKKLVSEWTWKLPVATEDTADDKTLDETAGNLPVYQNDRWELTLPVTSEDHPMSKEQVIELLPKEIVLTWEKAEEENPEQKPEQGEGESQPEQKPEQGEGETQPEQKPEQGEGETQPEQKPEQGEGETQPEQNPEQGEGETHPEQKPEQGEGETQPEQKPEQGEGETQPEQKPEQGEGETQPEQKPEAGSEQLSLLEDQKSNPLAGEGTTPPADGETTPPTDEGEGATPPVDGGTTPPTDEGTTPPADGETTPPTDEGATPPAGEGITPPAGEGTTPPTEEQQSKPNQAVAALTWEIADYPAEGASSGEFIATATLPAEYLLKEGVAPLQLFLLFRNGVPLEVLREHELDTNFSPAGTKINLFDYWREGDTEADRWKQDHQPLKSDGTENHNEDLPEDVASKSKGINKGHVLKFVSSGGGDGHYNKWTFANDGPYYGIVENKLQDGYPVVKEKPGDFWWSNVEIYDTKNDQEGPLDYLFDPSIIHPGKASFQNVQDLLQIDKDGYYYYDAGKNYARFDEGTNKFILYDAPAVYRANSGATDKNPGQFFPFQSEEQVRTYYTRENQNGTLEMDYTANPSSERFNHYFGMAMETRFVHKNGGQNYQGQQITYEFTGDDDVWVFIDDVLVADLGGIHDKATFKINFCTGKISIAQGTQNSKQTTLKNQFEAAGQINEKEFSGDTFADNTYHTLKFFFLERGNHESNMSLRYNLLPIPESELIKVDQLGKPVEGVEFSLYTADKDYKKDKKIFSGKTDAEGHLYLRDNTDMPLTFAYLCKKYNTQHFVLVEEQAAEGYRKIPEIHLHYHIYNAEKEIGVIETEWENLWETGASAQMKVTTTASNMIRYGDGNSIDLTGDDVNPDDLLMFAVVFQKRENKWLPLSGDALTGWEVEENNQWENILTAARNDPYLFKLGTGGAFQVEIENLPGKADEYYTFLINNQDGQAAQNARYYVAYFYSTADSLDSADSSNTYEITNQEEFTREFSSKLYVPNIKNYLMVHKKDEKMQSLNGATFCLYEAKDVTINADGSYTIKEKAVPYDTGITRDMDYMQGGLVFPTDPDKVLTNGTYYLIETAAPTGYIKNPNAVQIIVDDSGVYADAGKEKDRIWVARSVGSIVESMHQFAADDDVNATLHDIKLMTATSYEKESTVWSEWNENPASKEEMHLQYSTGSPTLDYGLIPQEVQEHQFPALVTDTGWSKLQIRQCMDKTHCKSNATKEDLGNEDIANLFARLATVIVGNDKVGGTGSLSVNKTVGGNEGDKTKAFNFTVTLNNETISGVYGEMTFTNGVATFTLKHGESKTAIGLPVGVGYTVTEAEANQDGYTTVSTGAVGTIVDDEIAKVVFTNSKDKPNKPNKPNEPDKPDKPDKPNKPNEPDDPDKPDPKDPVEKAPEQPKKQDTVKPPKKTPNTGDARAVGLCTALAGISLAGLTAAYLGKKKR